MLSDNTSEFTSAFIERLCAFEDIKKCEVYPYKPSSNWAVESASRLVKDVSRTVVNPHTVDWDIALEDLQFTLNKTVHESTGYTPHLLLHGYHSIIPVALLDDAKPPAHTTNYDDYMAWRLLRATTTPRKARVAIKRARSLIRNTMVNLRLILD